MTLESNWLQILDHYNCASNNDHSAFRRLAKALVSLLDVSQYFFIIVEGL